MEYRWQQILAQRSQSDTYCVLHCRQVPALFRSFLQFILQNRLFGAASSAIMLDEWLNKTRRLFNLTSKSYFSFSSMLRAKGVQHLNQIKRSIASLVSLPLNNGTHSTCISIANILVCPQNQLACLAMLCQVMTLLSNAKFLL